MILCSGESLEAVRLTLLVGFGGIEAIDVSTDFPYRVPFVDRGKIAVPLVADPISDSYINPHLFNPHLRHQFRSRYV